jgi:hypothetical protein
MILERKKEKNLFSWMNRTAGNLVMDSSESTTSDESIDHGDTTDELSRLHQVAHVVRR